MSNKKELFHIWSDKDEDFLKRIDEFGGWPCKAKSVIMRHSCETERPCYFSEADYEIRDEWNTTIMLADKYYLWKLSPEAITKIKQEIKDKLITQLHIYLKQEVKL